jgi:hypothetical protein
LLKVPQYAEIERTSAARLRLAQEWETAASWRS